MKEFFYTYAAFFILCRDEARITAAVVAAIGVDTAAIATDAFIFTLITILTSIVFRVSSLTLRALTREGANIVDTETPFTQTWDGFTLINIWKKGHCVHFICL